MSATYQTTDIISVKPKNTVRQPRWTRKQSSPNKSKCRRFWPSLHQRIGSTWMKRRCFLLQSLTVGWQQFTSAERKWINLGSPWPFSAMQMDHRSFQSSTLAEQGTPWHSIDKTQTWQDSVTVTTRLREWHLLYLMSKISSLQHDCVLTPPKGTSKNWISQCDCRIERSSYLLTISVVTISNTVQPTSNWSSSHQIWPLLSSHLTQGSSAVSRLIIVPCSVNGHWNLIQSERKTYLKSIFTRPC